MTGNDFVTFFLRTPLHVFLGNTMLITVTGRKSGKPYSTPVGFYRKGSDLWILTSRERTWWRNVRHGAPVSLLLHGRVMKAYAEAELDERTVEERLCDYVRHVPMSARSLGIRMQQGAPLSQDISRIAKEKLFVKVSIPR
ncbi:MAG TPA: nitroreductase/quinone reductase family protein [Anaerolineales bacterium]|nr:nitroreductase/quinone reductase family protein [Anaerolineales bacterium]